MEWRSSRTSRVASEFHSRAMSSGLYESWHSSRLMYSFTSSGWTMASDLKSSAGAAMRNTALKACTSVCAWGRLSQSVPSSFQVKASASSRSTSVPMLARKSISAAMSWKTAGLR